MGVRQLVEKFIKSSPPHSIRASNRSREEADAKVERIRKEWMEARKDALLQSLTQSYGITIFGSARLSENSQDFQLIQNLTKKIVLQRKINIITGGGPGIMLAAHKGAKEAVEIATKEGRKFHANTFSVNIILPHEQTRSVYADKYTLHDEFSTRLQEIIDKTQGVYIAPGGYGTLLELSMILQLKQVQHLSPDFPILAHPFWKPILSTIDTQMYDKRVEAHLTPLISEEDTRLIHFTDDIEAITAIFVAGYDKWHSEFKTRQLKEDTILSMLTQIPQRLMNL